MKPVFGFIVPVVPAACPRSLTSANSAIRFGDRAEQQWRGRPGPPDRELVALGVAPAGAEPLGVGFGVCGDLGGSRAIQSVENLREAVAGDERPQHVRVELARTATLSSSLLNASIAVQYGFDDGPP